MAIEVTYKAGYYSRPVGLHPPYEGGVLYYINEEKSGMRWARKGTSVSSLSNILAGHATNRSLFMSSASVNALRQENFYHNFIPQSSSTVENYLKSFLYALPLGRATPLFLWYTFPLTNFARMPFKTFSRPPCSSKYTSMTSGISSLYRR